MTEDHATNPKNSWQMKLFEGYIWYSVGFFILVGGCCLVFWLVGLFIYFWRYTFPITGLAVCLTALNFLFGDNGRLRHLREKLRIEQVGKSSVVFFILLMIGLPFYPSTDWEKKAAKEREAERRYSESLSRAKAQNSAAGKQRVQQQKQQDTMPGQARNASIEFQVNQPTKTVEITPPQDASPRLDLTLFSRTQLISLVFTRAATNKPVPQTPEQFIEVTHTTAQQLGAGSPSNAPSAFLLTLMPASDTTRTITPDVESRILTYGPDSAYFAKQLKTGDWQFSGVEIAGKWIGIDPKQPHPTVALGRVPTTSEVLDISTPMTTVEKFPEDFVGKTFTRNVWITHDWIKKNVDGIWLLIVRDGVNEKMGPQMGRFFLDEKQLNFVLSPEQAKQVSRFPNGKWALSTLKFTIEKRRNDGKNYYVTVIASID